MARSSIMSLLFSLFFCCSLMELLRVSVVQTCCPPIFSMTIATTLNVSSNPNMSITTWVVFGCCCRGGTIIPGGPCHCHLGGYSHLLGVMGVHHHHLQGVRRSPIPSCPPASVSGLITSIPSSRVQGRSTFTTSVHTRRSRV